MNDAPKGIWVTKLADMRSWFSTPTGKGVKYIRADVAEVWQENYSDIYALTQEQKQRIAELETACEQSQKDTKDLVVDRLKLQRRITELEAELEKMRALSASAPKGWFGNE